MDMTSTIINTTLLILVLGLLLFVIDKEAFPYVLCFDDCIDDDYDEDDMRL